MPLLKLLFPFPIFLLKLKYSRRFSTASLLILSFWFGYGIYFTQGDIVFYRDDFKTIAQYDYRSFFHLIINTFDADEKFLLDSENVYNSKPDIYALFTAFIISRITDNARFFFAIISVIYFFLLKKFVDEVLKMTSSNQSVYWFLFLFFLISIVPFYVGVTGIRFWTALFFFLLFTFRFINSRKIYNLYLIILSGFIHYTFFFAASSVIFFGTIKISSKYFKFLSMLAFFYVFFSLSGRQLDIIQIGFNFIDNESISSSASGYLDSERLIEIKKDENSSNWYVSWRVHLLNLFFLCFYVFDFFRSEKVKENSNLIFVNLYHFFFFISVFTFDLGSLSRFVYIFYIISIVRILELISKNSSFKIRFWTFWAVPVLCLHIAVIFRAGFYFIDPFLMITPIPFLFSIFSPVSLSELIVGH